MTLKLIKTACDKCGNEYEQVTPRSARAHRKALRLTLRQLAARMGISMQHLCDLEKGRREFSAAMTRRFLAAVKEG